MYFFFSKLIAVQPTINSLNHLSPVQQQLEEKQKQISYATRCVLTEDEKEERKIIFKTKNQAERDKELKEVLERLVKTFFTISVPQVLDKESPLSFEEKVELIKSKLFILVHEINRHLEMYRGSKLITNHKNKLF